jgi:hypothetical protein
LTCNGLHGVISQKTNLFITTGVTTSDLRDSRVEAGLNTSTVSLRVVGGDEKGTQFLGCNLATLFLGDINTGTWPSRFRESGI